LDSKANEQVKALVERVGRTVIDVALDVVRQKHDDLDQLQDYFQAVEKDIVTNIRRLGTVNHDENEDDQTP
ncbi:MAG: AAA family ATPase, partial [Anaerolineales bacterium]|nr:AAA family ATPase [Anaerolineales bacterium]